MAFSPAPDDIVNNLFKVPLLEPPQFHQTELHYALLQCFSTDGHLIVNYRCIFTSEFGLAAVLTPLFTVLTQHGVNLYTPSVDAQE